MYCEFLHDLAEYTRIAMPEWMSCQYWHDVQLVCGSRVFSAHRVVLASASTFLRDILLSMEPVEEEYSVFLLPEFDCDVMASILHYIYNGEIYIPESDIHNFINIAQLLKVHLDAENLNEKLRTQKLPIMNKILPENYKVLNLVKNIKNCESVKQENFVNELLTHVAGDGRDITIKMRKSEGMSHIEYINTLQRDRQRNTNLRDTFSETNPKNSSGNGACANTREIRNEVNQTPPSTLGTNVKQDDPTRNTTLQRLETYASYSSNKSTLPNYSLHHNHFQSLQITNPTTIDIHALLTKFQENSLRKYTNYFRENISQDILKHDDTISITFSNIYSNNQNRRESKTTASENVTENAVRKVKFGRSLKISNSIMENPWRSRLVNNFRPFSRRKSEGKSSLTSTQDQIICDTKTTNDANNNQQRFADEHKLIISQDVQFENNTTIHYEQQPSQSSDQKGILEVSKPSLSVSNRYYCTECNKSFSQLRNYKYHMSVHRGTKEFAATCPVCGKYFNDKGYLSSHMKIHMNKKEYKCSECPKSFNQRVAYNMHMRIHTGLKPHVCEQCGKTFSRKMLLKQHLRTHSGERPYACPHCERRFADRSNMTLHMRLHSGIKPFSCSLCAKSFTKKHHLKSHLNFHTGAKPYTCPRCQLGFTQSSNMRTHLKKCSGGQSNSTN